MKYMNKIQMTTAAALLATLIVGCGEQTPAPTPSPEAQAQAEAPDASLPEGLLATAPLGDAVGVVEARKEVKPGSDIVLTGYIGGREEPLVEGRAIFTLADAKSMTRCDAISASIVATKRSNRRGSNGPLDGKWGDYLACRRHSPDGLTWASC